MAQPPPRHLPKGTPPRPPPPRPDQPHPAGIASSTSAARKSVSPIRKGKTGDHRVNASKVPKNAKGGVLVTEEEIETAFRFLDIHGTGRITLNNLKKRLSMIYKGLPPSQYKLLLGDKPEMSLKDLKELLLENTVENFDPVAEAFKVYDPEETGFIQPKVLKEVFHGLELAKLTDEDMLILVEAADMDKDGRIGLQDFRMLSDAARPQQDDSNNNSSSYSNEEAAGAAGRKGVGGAEGGRAQRESGAAAGGDHARDSIT